MKKSNNIISDWLDKYGDPEIDKKVEKELDLITNKFMNNQSENTFKKIHDDCREIFKGDRDLSEKLTDFNEYLNNNINGDNGTMRTLLVIGKPFKNNQIVKNNLEILLYKLKTNLNTDFI